MVAAIPASTKNSSTESHEWNSSRRAIATKMIAAKPSAVAAWTPPDARLLVAATAIPSPKAAKTSENQRSDRRILRIPPAQMAFDRHDDDRAVGKRGKRCHGYKGHGGTAGGRHDVLECVALTDQNLKGHEHRDRAQDVENGLRPVPVSRDDGGGNDQRQHCQIGDEASQRGGGIDADVAEDEASPKAAEAVDQIGFAGHEAGRGTTCSTIHRIGNSIAKDRRSNCATVATSVGIEGGSHQDDGHRQRGHMADKSLMRDRKGGNGGEQNDEETESNRQVLETSGETMDCRAD